MTGDRLGPFLLGPNDKAIDAAAERARRTKLPRGLFPQFETSVVEDFLDTHTRPITMRRLTLPFVESQ